MRFQDAQAKLTQITPSNSTLPGQNASKFHQRLFRNEIDATISPNFSKGMKHQFLLITGLFSGPGGQRSA
ncbi:hypothetical protein ACFV2X_41555 [Streptomyces sp. NPDC059679]|uniref:hypothetical protein n=1 Tax=Streptomyces sp. NPDC059679 TaxID=3346903 RepID=UPI0036B779D8